MSTIGKEMTGERVLEEVQVDGHEPRAEPVWATMDRLFFYVDPPAKKKREKGSD